jgi:hypothetical protein
MFCGPVSLTESISAAMPDNEYVGTLEGKEVTDLNNLLTAIRENEHYQAFQILKRIPPDYKETFTTANNIKNVVIVALILTGIVAYVLNATGHLKTFPEDFMHWIKSIDPVDAIIGGGVAIVLIAGASWIIHKAKTEKDPLLHDNDRGAFEGVGEYLDSGIASYTKDGENYSVPYGVYLDRSMLNSFRTRACLYYAKPVCGHYTVSTVVAFLGTPVYLVGVVAFNAIRAVVIPFYILFQMALDLCREEKEASGYKLTDIPIEIGRSIENILVAPFYALAYMMTSIYSLANPMPGRKRATTVEWMWNKKVSLARSFWSMQGRQPLFNFRKEDNFYLAGCWHEVGYADFDANGNLIEAYYMPGAVEEYEKKPKEKGTTYTLYLRSAYTKKVEENQEAIKQLIGKEKAVLAALKKANKE